MSDEVNDLLKTKDKEIADLKKRLEARNTSFEKNLQWRADAKLHELEKSIGQAIVSTVGNDLAYAFKHSKFRLDYESSLYGKGGWRIVFLDEKERKDVSQKIADFEMKRFQESLDNFSWAVNNQNNFQG